MLQEETLHQEGQEEPGAVSRHSERHAQQGKGGRQRFDITLDIPLIVELPQPPLDGGWAARGGALDMFFRLPADRLVDLLVRVDVDPIDSRGNHVASLCKSAERDRGATHMPPNRAFSTLEELKSL